MPSSTPLPYETLPSALLNDSPSPAIIIPRHVVNNADPKSTHLPPLRAFYSDLRTLVAQTSQMEPFKFVRKGDRVVILAMSSMEFVVAFLTVLERGGSVCPVNPMLGEEEMGALVGRVGARWLVVSRNLPGGQLAIIRRLAVKLHKTLYEIWTIAHSPPPQPATTTAPKSKNPSTKTIVKAQTFSSRFEVETRVISSGVDINGHGGDAGSLDRKSEALYLFTSGATGRPKGVPLTHGNIITTLSNIRECYDLSANDCTYLVMPLFHVHGLIGVFLSTLFSGGTVVAPPKFHSAMFWNDIVDYGVTWYSAVPSIHQTLLTKAKETFSGNTGKIRFIRSGSSSLPPTVLLSLERTFGAPVIEAYAMTETSHQIASNFLPPGIRKTSSVGKGRGVEVLVLGDDDLPALTMKPGEVCVLGPSIFSGYDEGDSGKARFWTDEKGQRWFRTGDYGYLDENQFLFLLGRLSELIYHRSENVSPLEIEAALLEIDGVAEAVAFAFPPRQIDETGSEVHGSDESLHAAIVLHPRSRRHVTEASLMEFAKAVLPPSRVPQRIHITDVIPKTATGKLKRTMSILHVSAELKNSNAVRTIDLTATGIVREKISLIFSDGERSVESYDLAVPLGLAANVSSVAVLERRDRKAGGGVKVEVAEGPKNSAFKVYRVKLSSPLEKGAKSSLDISIVYTQAVKPYPKVVDQTDPQYLEFETNAYISSIYGTEKQKTSVKLPSSTLVSDIVGPKPHSRAGSTVTFGPYQDTEKNAASTMNLHYEDNNGLLVAKTFRKDVEISHLGGNMAVMESYDLHHRGALLRDSAFSRVDYQFSSFRHTSTNVVKELKIHLPGNISNVYFRDDIGNVSTSNLRRGKIGSLLHIRPRYPLESQAYQLEIPFIGSMKNVSIETATLSVALPDGATNVKVSLPFEADSQDIDTYFTNLDTIGRPRVNIVKKNVADEFAVMVKITYHYPFMLLLRKPLVVSTVIFGFLIIGMIMARLDLSIVKTEEDVKRDKICREVVRVSKFAVKIDRAFGELEKVFDSYKASKNLEKFRTEAQAGHIMVAEHLEGVQSCFKRSQIVNVRFAGLIEHLLKEYKAKMDRIKKLHEAVTLFLTEAVDGVDEDKKKAVQIAVGDAEVGIERSDERIRSMLAGLNRHLE
ncbi:hypothetical protein HDU67_000212 [Dinochytrium kinnereticum]|nr:hypothetical protein HDU67_000212 [Dinochytrium kinnereticum]